MDAKCTTHIMAAVIQLCYHCQKGRSCVLSGLGRRLRAVAEGERGGLQIALKMPCVPRLPRANSGNPSRRWEW